MTALLRLPVAPLVVRSAFEHAIRAYHARAFSIHAAETERHAHSIGRRRGVGASASAVAVRTCPLAFRVVELLDSALVDLVYAVGDIWEERTDIGVSVTAPADVDARSLDALGKHGNGSVRSDDVSAVVNDRARPVGSTRSVATRLPIARARLLGLRRCHRRGSRRDDVVVGSGLSEAPSRERRGDQHPAHLVNHPTNQLGRKAARAFSPRDGVLCR